MQDIFTPGDIQFFQVFFTVLIVLSIGFSFTVFIGVGSILLGVFQTLRTGSLRNGVIVIAIWFSMLFSLILVGVADIFYLLYGKTQLSIWQMIAFNIAGVLLATLIVSSFIKFFLFSYLAEMQIARRILEYAKITYENYKNRK